MIRRKKRLQPMIPLASMGDIAFLLIIFFMLTSSFMKENNVQLEPAASRDIDEVETPPIGVAVDQEGMIWLQGNIVSAPELKSSLEVLLDSQKGREVRVSVDKNQLTEVYRPVVKAIGDAGGTPLFTGEKKQAP